MQWILVQDICEKFDIYLKTPKIKIRINSLLKEKIDLTI